jgi:NitT/TauT family transport system permease protein
MLRLRDLMNRAWLPAALIALWEICARVGLLDPIFFPPPSALVMEGLAMVASSELTGHIRQTLVRTLEGAFAGVGAGIICGILMGANRAFRRSLEPLMSAFAALPKVALLPLLLLALGVGEAPRIALIGAAALATCALPVLDGVRNLDSTYVELARNYGARSWNLIAWIYLPGCLPHILTGIRLALTRALGACIAVEVVNSRTGLGSLIWAGWQSFRPEHVYIGVFTAAILGAIFHGSMRSIEKVLVPWKSSQHQQTAWDSKPRFRFSLSTPTIR